MAERIEQLEQRRGSDRAESLQRRRRVLALVGGAALLAAVGACGSGSDGREEPTEAGGSARPEPIGEALDLSSAGFHELPAPPIAPRGPAVLVAAGDEVIVWGGTSEEDASSPGLLHNDGALLSLADGRWTEMPAAPFVEGLYDAIGAWDGEELIVIGTECERDVPPATDGSPPACPRGPAAAAFDPEAFTWRRLDPPPIGPHESYGAPVLGRGLTVAGEGRALFTYGWDAESITWDRSTEAWGTVASPSPDDEWVEYCADPVRQQVVAMPRRQPGTGGPTTLRVLGLEDAAWREPVVSEQSVDSGVTCGDGHLTTSSLETDHPDGMRSVGWLFDVSTGEVEPAFEPSPDLRNSWIVGPWLFARSSITIGEIDGGPVPHPTAVRLVRGGETVEVEPPDGFGGGTYLPGIGLLGFSDRAPMAMVLWRMPAELQP